MDEGMRQRLVGALVLIALASLLLPLLFDFDGAYVVDTRSTIPVAPDIQTLDIVRAGPQKEAAEVASHDAMFRFADSREAATDSVNDDSARQDQVEGLNAKGIPFAWIVQVASFADIEKARALTGQLMADGYKAYSRRAELTGEAHYRVYVGPKIAQGAMLKEKQAIEAKYKLKTLLLVFEP